jgi:pyrroline-5-carboxylate reductase
MLNQKIGFLGAGQMARALARGFVDAGLVGPDQVHAADLFPQALTGFEEVVAGAHTCASNVDVVSACDVVFLAVKPQFMPEVLAQLKPLDLAGKLIVSIAAGVTLETLSRELDSSRVIRVMPNTPCLVATCAAGYCLGAGASDADGELIQQLLGAVGIAFSLKESLIDVVTGLSGSGPAFAFQVIEALSDGGVKMGLPRDVATQLAAQTLKGAAEMVLVTKEHPAVLKDRVASPGGTTIAGLAELEAGATRASFIAAVTAATQRSIELGKS